MPDYGPRVDPDTGALHARVHQAHEYSRITPLRLIRVAGGTIEVSLITSPSPGTRRMVRVHAHYTLEHDPVDRIVICRDELDEASTLRHLEREIRAASSSATPDTTPTQR